ncbi:M28 family metallopeptidase [Algoriphagus zhangzhouensis]|uniref:Peptidase family M28 n=1 Tax=Algoriphagus zhangzhouensis TaxID=1073327 RepID=A0A1M7Z8S8_9BACT|nr:M28 family peptidase [Algoriphagus zhangzhouensis]TDY47543.1 peptidase M28-like protein [Algoriphagus zhangzhouensis]SHO61321.1 Peptidase family M28 [Algoriphagus zhangzhouensis]
MKKRFALTGALALSLSLGSFAQNPVQVKYANTITAGDLEEYLTFLASDEMRGRDTGSPEGLIAANYLADFYKELGFTGPVDGGYFQAVPLVSTKFEEVNLKIGKNKLVSNEDYVFIGDGDMKKSTKTDLVFLGLVSDENLAKVDVKDKLVGIWAVGERSNNLINTVMDAGAAGIVIVTMEGQANFDRIANRYKSLAGKGRIGFDKPTDQRPIFMVSSDKMGELFGSSVEDLKEAAKSNPESIKSQKASYQVEKSKTPVEAYNVMGFLEGTDKKDEVLVISSHYDHVGVSSTGEVFNGADDDGSGTVSVMEIAQAFATAAKDGIRPRRSILFLNVTGEEKGLLGSQYYSENPIFPIANTVNNINIDMVGRIDYEYQDAENKDYVYVIGSEMLSTDLKKINEYNNITYTDLILDYRYDAEDDPNRFYYRSDHYNFAKFNIPVIFFFNGVHDDYHQVTDTVDKIEFPLMTKRAQLIFHTSWDLANRENRTRVDGTNTRTDR